MRRTSASRRRRCISQGILITHFAIVYAHERGEKDVTGHVGVFNGIFGAFMLLTGVSGNMISSVFFFFAPGAGNDCADEDGNSTSAGTNAMPQSVVNGLFSIYLLSVVCGIACATVMLPGPAVMAAERAARGLVRKTPLFAPFIYKTIFLPRQARDRHRENSKSGVFLRTSMERERNRPL